MRRRTSLFSGAILLPTALLALAGAVPGGDGDRAAAPAGTPADGAAAGAVFERLRGMAGRWRGESSQGWLAEIDFEVVAAGSVVMQTSRFEAHPGETMVTMFHRDGGRLLLTHYCVAGNQPRLVATRVEDGGRVVGFSWLDGTGLASRDEGHMDGVVLTFDGEDGYRSRWTWYQDGSERWMEEIRYERVP